MKRGNKLVTFFSLIIFSLFLTGLSSAAEVSLGEFKQGDCFNITQMCSSCSYVNISSVTQNGNTLLSNQPMSYFGNGEWRYEFCDTDETGWGDVRGQGDIDGVDDPFAVRYYITSTGSTQEGNSWVIILAQGFAMILFLVISFTFKSKWKVKAFLQLMSLLMVIIMLNTSQVLFSISEQVSSMLSVSLITSITLFTIMLVYILVAYTIEVVGNLKKKRAKTWNPY